MSLYMDQHIDREKLEEKFKTLKIPASLLRRSITVESLELLYETSPSSFVISMEDKYTQVPLEERASVLDENSLSVEIRENYAILQSKKPFDIFCMDSYEIRNALCELLLYVPHLFPKNIEFDIHDITTSDYHKIVAFSMTHDGNMFKVNPNRLTSSQKQIVASVDPTLFKKYNIELSGLRIETWELLIGHDKKYRNLALKHMHTIYDKKRYCKMLSMVDHAKLTVSLLKKKPKSIKYSTIANVLKGKSITTEVKDYVNQQILIEMLQGKRKKPIKL